VLWRVLERGGLRHWLGEGVFYTKGMDIFRNFVRYEKDTGNIQTVE
jgi:hypothetical protein